MTRRREILAFYPVLFENKLGGRLLEGERLLETIRYLPVTLVKKACEFPNTLTFSVHIPKTCPAFGQKEGMGILNMFS